MSWGEWMVVSLTIEEELKIEQQSRSILGSSDNEQVRDLCASLAKQNAFQAKLISQAVRHITQLEAQMALDMAELLDPGGCDAAKQQLEFGNSDLSHPGGIRDRNPLRALAMRVLAPFLWALGYALGLLAIARQATIQAHHDS